MRIALPRIDLPVRGNNVNTSGTGPIIVFGGEQPISFAVGKLAYF